MRQWIWATPLALALALGGCKGVEAGNCDDDKDNDKDGQTDCDDVEDCGSDNACLVDEICDNGVAENDGDNFVDCADRDCDVAPNCDALEVCDDGIDNDLDFATDCADGSCADDPICNAGVLEIQDVQVNFAQLDTQTVTVNNVFVTAVRGAAGQNVNLNVQEPQGDTIAGLTYPENAGLGLFIPIAVSGGLTIPAIGDCVDVTGEVDDFNGQTQLRVEALSIVANPASCGTFPLPFVIPSVSPAVTFGDLATDLDPVAGGNQEGLLTEVYEGVLVEIGSVQVVADTAQVGFGEFAVAEQANLSGPRINIDDLFFVVPTQALGQNFVAIRGIYTDVFNFKIQPRSAADIQTQ
jgi:hypothetical protein